MFRTSAYKTTSPSLGGSTADETIQRLKPKKTVSLVTEKSKEKHADPLSLEQLKEQVESEVVTTEVVSVMVGRVRFEGIVKQTEVQHLICEEVTLPQINEILTTKLMRVANAIGNSAKKNWQYSNVCNASKCSV